MVRRANARSWRTHPLLLSGPSITSCWKLSMASHTNSFCPEVPSRVTNSRGDRLDKKPLEVPVARLAAITQYAWLNTVSICFASLSKSPPGPCIMHRLSIQRYRRRSDRVTLTASWKVSGSSEVSIPKLIRDCTLTAVVQKCVFSKLLPHGWDRAK